MTHQPTVKVFIAPDCPPCEALLEDFRRRGVDFELIDLTRAPERMDELRAATWERRLPVVVDHERVSVGFEGESSSFAELGLE